LQGKGSRVESERPGLYGLSRGGGVRDPDLDDGASGSGVAAIEYRVDGGEWKNYSSAVRVRPYDVVEACATDNAGNTSEVLTVTRRAS
jgi:hypothetical protein